jgi:hypothetical protein
MVEPPKNVVTLWGRLVTCGRLAIGLLGLLIWLLPPITAPSRSLPSRFLGIAYPRYASLRARFRNGRAPVTSPTPPTPSPC